ncbi:MAG: PIN domain-containing protein [Nitriliruptorales bacterium]|nr:PIN domain-containing protein [Nitriliruptorales bacterium]
MIVVDTTVLVYAVGQDHPLRRPCRDIVAAIRDGRVGATTSPQVVQEFAHVRSRRRPRGDAASLAGDFARLLAPLIVVDEEDLEQGLSLFSNDERLGAFDAVAALRRDADALVSADRAFAAVPQLPYLDPGDTDRLAVLTGR